MKIHSCSGEVNGILHEINSAVPYPASVAVHSGNDHAIEGDCSLSRFFREAELFALVGFIALSALIFAHHEYKAIVFSLFDLEGLRSEIIFYI